MFRRIKNLWALSNLDEVAAVIKKDPSLGISTVSALKGFFNKKKMAQIITRDDELKDFPREV